MRTTTLSKVDYSLIFDQVFTYQISAFVRYYSKGEVEAAHHYQHSYVSIFVLTGKIEVNGMEYSEKDVIVFSPYESINLVSVEDNTIVVLVKKPGDEEAIVD